MSTTQKALGSTPVIRKLYTIGRGFALYLPAKWVRENIDTSTLHVTVTTNDDGSFTVRPFKLSPQRKP